MTRNRNMDLSRTDHVKMNYFPSLKRSGHHGKGEVGVTYLDFSKIFDIFLYDVLMQKLGSLV